MSVGCQILDWDSAFFGMRIGRIASGSLDAPRAREALQWAREQRMDCLYFLADPGEPETIRAAEDHGFRLVDVRLTLEASPRPLRPPSARIRVAAEADIARLRDIAASSHSDSRFYADGHFARARCDELYRVWIEKSCKGGADRVLVADLGEGACGYITCHAGDGCVGSIGLVGIDAGARGSGLGTELVQASLDWFAAQRIPEVTVVTQGRNRKAQRLYQRSGFLTRSVGFWYHVWPNPAP